MAPGSSPELDEASGRALLEVARASLAHGVTHGRALPVAAERYPESLRALGACFVTLRRAGALRGCIGSLEATRPLIEDDAGNAFAAGFRDPRFAPLGAAELEELEVHVAVLGAPVPLPCASEDELLAELRPGIDGLVLREGARRSTFLPAVWESLPEPAAFLRELRRKAGLPPRHWSPAMRFWRYTVQEFG
jgi:AmmeMemoRadiSam system protein A